MPGPRNNAAFFADMIPVDLSVADFPTPNAVGLYITSGGVVKFETLSGGPGVTRTVTFGDGAYVWGMITKVIKTGTGALGIHYLV